MASGLSGYAFKDSLSKRPGFVGSPVWSSPLIHPTQAYSARIATIGSTAGAAAWASVRECLLTVSL
jgi:hypothetical protein